MTPQETTEAERIGALIAGAVDRCTESVWRVIAVTVPPNGVVTVPHGIIFTDGCLVPHVVCDDVRLTWTAATTRNLTIQNQTDAPVSGEVRATGNPVHRSYFEGRIADFITLGCFEPDELDAGVLAALLAADDGPGVPITAWPAWLHAAIQHAATIGRGRARVGDS
ncbi:hypothetical protein LCGC14_1622520 [marine sediment metagenome]|uniref:Uncharacterized protein n=1 Tax=marine sediment metagenome TaxID=412755 RepID=A0A0F9I515_9ZZZZ